MLTGKVIEKKPTRIGTSQTDRSMQIKIIEKYVNLWDPLKFVTEDQLKEMIKEHANRKNRK